MLAIFADTPTLGLLIGLPVAGLIAAVCLGATVLGFWNGIRGNGFDPDGSLAVGLGGLVCLLITLAITSVAMWPWKHDYHYWVPKEGTVQAIDKRLVPAGDSGMQEKIVVTLNGQPYGITDTRASLLKPGDWVSISCKKAYEWGSSNHGWDCRWNDATYKNGATS